MEADCTEALNGTQADRPMTTFNNLIWRSRLIQAIAKQCLDRQSSLILHPSMGDFAPPATLMTADDSDLLEIRHRRQSMQLGQLGRRRSRPHNVVQRYCHSCNATETPEWRRGPDGARTLCNACGLHYAKLVRKQKTAAQSSSTLSSVSATVSPVELDHHQ